MATPSTFPEWIYDGSEIADPYGHGERAVRFLRSLRHPKSILPARAFQLDPWQERIVRRIYGPRHEDGTRMVNTVALLLPRGNRKTSLAAALALLHTIGPERRPGGEAIFAAADRKQAGIGFREAAGIIREDKRLVSAVGTLQAQIENNTALGFDNTEAIARLREVRAELDAVRAAAANLPRYVEGLRPDGTAVISNTETGTPITEYTRPPMPVPTEPVSIADHPPGGTPSAGGGGGGRAKRGGGGSKAKPKQDDFAKEVEDTRARIAALEAEAVVLTAVAASGREYGDALEFAQKKAELLTAAQEAGKEITPALEADIDKLAEAYMTAGLNAESAAQKMEQIKEQSERGHRALEDMFGSVIDGSMSAKDAVAQLLLEIAKVQMMNALFSLPGIGGVASGLGGLLTPKIPGFATGGDHKGGYRIVGEKGPELEATGPARYFNANQTQKMLGGGGQQGMDVNVTVSVDQNGNLQAFVDKRAGSIVQQGFKQYDKGTQNRVVHAMQEHQRRRSI